MSPTHDHWQSPNLASSIPSAHCLLVGCALEHALQIAFSATDASLRARHRPLTRRRRHVPDSRNAIRMAGAGQPTSRRKPAVVRAFRSKTAEPNGHRLSFISGDQPPKALATQPGHGRLLSHDLQEAVAVGTRSRIRNRYHDSGCKKTTSQPPPTRKSPPAPGRQ